jgi:hypothetical protein
MARRGWDRNGGLVELAPQRFVAKRSSAMKIAQLGRRGKMHLNKKDTDIFLVIGTSASSSGEHYDLRTSE